MNYELGISPSEAKRRTEEESLVSINLINEDDSEFISLTENEKMVLFYLCRSAFWIDRIAYQLQNKHNLDFYHFIKTNADEGKQYYKDVLKLFLAQKSINSLDSNGDMINAVLNLLDSNTVITGGLFENNTGIYGGLRHL